LFIITNCSKFNQILLKSAIKFLSSIAELLNYDLVSEIIEKLKQISSQAEGCDVATRSQTVNTLYKMVSGLGTA